MMTVLATSLCGKFVLETNGNHQYWTRNLTGRTYRQPAGKTLDNGVASLVARSNMGY